MKIIEPYVEIITEPNPLKRIELCGRVCYKSESKITAESAKAFVERAINKGHTSILEHSRVEIGSGVLTNPLHEPYGYTYRRKTSGDCDKMNCLDVWEA